MYCIGIKIVDILYTVKLYAVVVLLRSILPDVMVESSEPIQS